VTIWRYTPCSPPPFPFLFFLFFFGAFALFCFPRQTADEAGRWTCTQEQTKGRGFGAESSRGLATPPPSLPPYFFFFPHVVSTSPSRGEVLADLSDGTMLDEVTDFPLSPLSSAFRVGGLGLRRSYERAGPRRSRSPQMRRSLVFPPFRPFPPFLFFPRGSLFSLRTHPDSGRPPGR